VHVITTPPPGSASGLLWQRFASLLEIDPAGVDLTRARPNASLGMAETEFLRRLNQALPDEVPDWFYMWNVKEAVAHQALADRPREGRLALPASRDPWAKGRAEELAAALGGSGYDLIGDLDELRPQPATGPYAGPADQPAERVLAAAVTAAAALVVNQYRKAYPAARPQPGPARPGGLSGRIEATVASSPRLKRTVRELSSRFPAVRQLRIAAWRSLERRRAHDHPSPSAPPERP
jgi:hypothetical protein